MPFVNPFALLWVLMLRFIPYALCDSGWVAMGIDVAIFFPMPFAIPFAVLWVWMLRFLPYAVCDFGFFPYG